MRSLIKISLALLLVLAACKSRPGHVLPEDDMAEVLADMHTAEVLVEMNHAAYSNDSTKMALKQSVLLRHRVSMETFDTSLVWYGKNIGKYIEVYDKTIEILDQKGKDAGNVMVEGMMAMSGDSIDVWPGARTIKIDKRLPSNMVYFSLDADTAADASGDSYSWRMKLIDSDGAIIDWAVAATYADSTIAFMQFTTSQDAWNGVTFNTDSTKQLVKLRGYFKPSSDIRDILWVDSIMLVRRASSAVPANQMTSRPRVYKEY